MLGLRRTPVMQMTKGASGARLLLGARGGAGTPEPPDEMQVTGRFGRGAGRLAGVVGEAAATEGGDAEGGREAVGGRRQRPKRARRGGRPAPEHPRGVLHGCTGGVGSADQGDDLPARKQHGLRSRARRRGCLGSDGAEAEGQPARRHEQGARARIAQRECNETGLDADEDEERRDGEGRGGGGGEGGGVVAFGHGGAGRRGAAAAAQVAGGQTGTGGRERK